MHSQLDLSVKVYPNGIISSFLDKKKVGDSLTIVGPIGKLLLKNTKIDDGKTELIGNNMQIKPTDKK